MKIAVTMWQKQRLLLLLRIMDICFCLAAVFFTFTKTCTFLFVIQKLLHINFFYIDCKQSKFLYKIKDNLVTIV